ncbi:TetR/AcrR family transcriptional regulator [Glaciibacter psychrotolerans]|uniref:AcrR family transcriptional regulator n=1 Tax=Glaciibacter psychrotolerans TaxID=670054 RepID=A0A7Z0EHC5_9MICO|nr:TetR/AcrR family transcriptional regulator [Leifsonia psychrotolerans]NYJ20927.1 AcrR family transcriptional regulator [Leifsonia psychrotolerans]
MDPRRERTQVALREAILTLATERDISSITVSDVTRAAGINRATFYTHAESPHALLVAVLHAELAASKATFAVATERAGVTPRDVVLTTLDWIADHVEAHAAIYRSGLSRSSGLPLWPLLTEHFEDTLADYLGHHPEFLPASPAGLSPALLATGYAAYSAHGIVGAIAAWLTVPDLGSRALFTEVTVNSLAAWWTGVATPPSAEDPAANEARRSGGNPRSLAD